jgi:hypothetical protein
MSGDLVRGMSDSAADTVFGSGASDQDLEFLVWRIEQALKSLGAKDARIFAAEFCGDEIPSVMDGRPQPVLDFTFPLPDWAAL